MANMARLTAFISILVGLIAIITLFPLPTFVNGQQFAIFPPPATPTSPDVLGGPPPAAADLNIAPMPAPPNPAIGTQTTTVNNVPPDGVIPGIPVPANLLGLSLELSVANDFVGDKIGEPAYQLLNYLNSIRVRAGRGALLRIGGNTQDTAIFNESFTGILQKTGGGMSGGVPITPSLEYGNLIFELIDQVASAVQSEVIWGVNMVNNTAPFTVPMVKEARDALGDSLSFYLVGNEPDRYEFTGRRGANYTIEQYLSEWDDLTQRITSADYSDKPKQFAAPSVCCNWQTQQVLDAGMLSNFSDRLAAITAIQYPQSRCSTTTPYTAFGYMNQTNINAFCSYDADAVTTAVNAGIPYILVETNTASCIGIQDVSDTFTSAIWGVNMALQFAYRNHSGVLLHSGGQSTLYNTFTPPAYNSSNRIVSAKAWKTGPIFYSTLVLAEALHPSDGKAPVTVTDQLIQSEVLAAYNIYESGQIAKQVFINMINDPSGANNFNVQFPQPSNQPASVPYKLLAAPTLAEKDNITWAGQSFGWWSEGILQGKEQVLQAPCNNGNCTLSVPAPGVALAFINQASQPEATVTSTAFHPIGTQNPQIVLNSNGERGRRGGATSRGSAKSSAVSRFTIPSMQCWILFLLSIAGLIFLS
ncbi:hypothetical protein L7F22_037272 [Adiantum nelumboides]|nr:hypothetical protein [Adiantum nelumboides]